MGAQQTDEGKILLHSVFPVQFDAEFLPIFEKFRKKRIFLLTKMIMITIIITDMTGKERKHSRKRDAILEVLRSTSAHPCAQWVYDRLKPGIPDLSLGTVYRNLNLFRQEGLAASLGVVNGEERFDGIAEPHPHFVCSRCGAVIDLPPDERDVLVAALEHGFAGGEITANGGNKIAGQRLIIDFRKTVFYGLCKTCQNLSEKIP